MDRLIKTLFENLQGFSFSNLISPISVLAFILSVVNFIRAGKHRHEDNERQERIRREDNEKQDRLRREDNERQERQDKWRREDRQTERYEEARRNLYVTDNQDLQLLGVRELYNLYSEERKDKSEFKQSLRKKILDSISEYLRDIGVNIKQESNEDTSYESFQGDDIAPNGIKIVNKIFALFMKQDSLLPEGYQYRLQSADLRRADLRGAFLLERAGLYGREDQRDEEWIRSGDFRKSRLNNTDLSMADLRWAKLRRAYLPFASLRYAQLQNTELRCADLSGADLYGAQLQGALLEDTCLWYRDRDGKLQYTDLNGVALDGAVMGFKPITEVKEEDKYKPFSEWEKELSDYFKNYHWEAVTIDTDTADKSGIYGKERFKKLDKLYLRVLARVREEERKSGMIKLGNVEIPLTDCPSGQK